MRVLRRADYRAMPWKNGGGITHEVAREPAQGESFEWRLSLARIDRSGPFSDFSGYLRIMLLLEGEGFTLRSPGEPERVFRPRGEAQRFDGALPVQCELAGSSCTDLNLMVRDTREVSTRTARIEAPLALRARELPDDARRGSSGDPLRGRRDGAPVGTPCGAQHDTLILFVLQGACRVRDGAREEELAAWDTAIIEPVRAEPVRPDAAQREASQPDAARPGVIHRGPDLRILVSPAPDVPVPAMLFIAAVR